MQKFLLAAVTKRPAITEIEKCCAVDLYSVIFFTFVSVGTFGLVLGFLLSFLCVLLFWVVDELCL